MTGGTGHGPGSDAPGSDAPGAGDADRSRGDTGRGGADARRGSAVRARRAWYERADALVVAWALAAAVVAIIANLPGRPVSGWLAVHLMLLGAATSAILIWSQYFADTLVRRAGRGGSRSLTGRLVTHTVGAAAVVVGVPTGLWPLAAVGAVLVAAAIVWHAALLTRQVRGALPARFAPLVRWYIVAGLLLVIGIALGVLMARDDVGGTAHDRLYIAHIVLNLAGWIGLSTVGTGILLWPTVLHTRILPVSDLAARRALPLAAGGVLLAAAGCLVGARPITALGLLVYLAGVLLVVREGVRQARATPPTSYAAWSMGAAAGWFVGGVVALVVIMLVAPGWAEAGGALAGLLVPFVVGFVAQLISGALSHLIPVVIGGGPAAVRRMNEVMDRQGAFRAITVNGALLVALLPTPPAVHATLVGLAVAALLAVVPLAVVAIGRGGRDDVHVAPVSATERRGALSLHALSGGMFSAIGAVVLAVAVGVAFGAGAGAGATGVAPGAGSGGSAAVAPTGRTTTVQMIMKDMRFSPSTVRVPAGNRLVIHVTNKDQQVHDLTLATGVASGRLVGGESATVDAGVITKDVNGWCSITGHRQMGMVMRIVAVGAPSDEASGENGSGGHGSGDHGAGTGGGTSSAPSAADDVDLAKKPPASFRARDAVLPPASDSRVHRVTLRVRDVRRQVAPGVTQTLWTYNGTAPGPILRGKVGDRFVITLINDGDMGHSIDFHAGELSPDKPMRTINPGQSLTYTFTAERSGAWLYHCSTTPMSEHIANGMYGAVIIDPPGLDHVDQEFVFVQGEYYLGPQGKTADIAKIATENPDLVVFNGYADQYRYRPVAAKAGQRVRVWVVDAGPNRPTSFHVVGTQFDTVFKEGDYRLKDGGSTGTGGSQALDLQPAQGGFVEFTLPAAGDYSFITHIMSDAEKGAMGVFHVTG